MRRSASLLLTALAVLVAACEKKAPPAAAPSTAPAAAAPQTAAPTEPILVGQVGSLTGSEATFGISARQSISLALQEANAAGGVKGRPLALRVYDSQGKP
jgi:branched-chain amino acid transport system substrate-binding protein